MCCCCLTINYLCLKNKEEVIFVVERITKNPYFTTATTQTSIDRVFKKDHQRRINIKSEQQQQQNILFYCILIFNTEKKQFS